MPCHPSVSMPMRTATDRRPGSASARVTDRPDGESTTHHVYVAASEPRQGWCGECLKPAVLTFDLLAMEGDGVTKVGEVSGCPDCGTGVFGDELA